MTEEPILKSLRKPDVKTTLVEVGTVRFGDGSYPVIAGPVVIGSEDQIRAAARVAARAGASVLRGGLHHNGQVRHIPEDETLWMLQSVGLDMGLPTAAEIGEARRVDRIAEHIDILHIGAANMQNFGLLTAAGATGRPCILERGASATIDEWLFAAEYILNEDNEQVLLCESGIRTFEPRTRGTLDLSAVTVVQRLSHLPVIVDPSAAGSSELIKPLALGARAVGADGLMVSLDPNAEGDDGHLDEAGFTQLMDGLGVPAMRDEIDRIDREIVKLVGRRLSRAVEIGRIKASQGLPLYAPEREEELISEVRSDAERNGVDPAHAEELFRIILTHARAAQRAAVEALPR